MIYTSSSRLFVIRKSRFLSTIPNGNIPLFAHLWARGCASFFSRRPYPFFFSARFWNHVRSLAMLCGLKFTDHNYGCQLVHFYLRDAGGAGVWGCFFFLRKSQKHDARCRVFSRPIHQQEPSLGQFVSTASLPCQVRTFQNSSTVHQN